jgi:hypothetical protein
MKLLAAILSTCACFGTCAGVAALGGHGGGIGPLAITWTLFAVFVLWRTYRRPAPNHFGLIAVGAPFPVLVLVPLFLMFGARC